MKKILIIWIAMFTAIITLPAIAWASPAPESDFEFDEFAGGIRKYNGKASEVEIPGSIGGHAVVTIFSNAFADCSGIKSVIIPDSVTSIGDFAFNGCSSLTNITISSSVTEIKWGVFNGCSSLTKITIPSGVKSIEPMTFCGCSNLTEIVIPAGVKSIGVSAFSYCSSLSKITIPSSVTNIGSMAFSDCSSLVKITIPSGVTSIENSTFLGCSSLTQIVIPFGVTSIGDLAFDRCSSLTELTIPASVTSIGGDIFHNCNRMKVIKVKSGSYAETYAKEHGMAYQVIDGGNSTEDNRVNQPSGGNTGSLPAAGSKLTDTKTKADYVVTGSASTVAYAGTTDKKAVSLSIPATIKIGGMTYKVTSVEKNALKNNKKLQKITISGNVSNIGASAFQGCSALKTVKMGSKITSIGDKAFYGCKKLSSLTIGKNVSSIGKSAFQNCAALKKITIPAKVKKIGSSAFSGCKKLTGITVKSQKLTEKNVGSKAFAKAGSNNYKKMKVTVPAKKYAAYKKLLKKKGLSGKAKIV